MLEHTSSEQTRQADFIRAANAHLIGRDAEERVAWALTNLPGEHVLSSSFGVHAALMLHLATRVYPRIPVIFIDTGYLFPETYRFVDELTERLELNLHVCRPPLSPAWQEVRHGRLWENGVQGIEHYNRMNKVEPMACALHDLDAGTWLAGLRSDQSRSRSALPVLVKKDGRFKLHPVIDWRDRDTHRYLKQHDLP